MKKSGSGNQRGLALNELKLVPHNPRWMGLFSKEAEQLRETSGVIDVMHIGSTAIPDIDTKPVIDIAVLVIGDPSDPQLCRALTDQSYENRGEYGLPGRQFFTKGIPPLFHLHVVSDQTEHWNDWKAFRDYMLIHSKWRK